MKIAVIGAGNGGQAIAGFLSSIGIRTSLYDRNASKIENLRAKGCIKLVGKISAEGHVDCFTTNLQEAIDHANIIMVTTVANAHIEIAEAMASHLTDGQTIILNPGRTCGALVFKQALKRSACMARIFLAEAQTLVYACRIVENGIVNIIGIKDEVPLAATPSSDTDEILKQIKPLYPCFTKAPNVLHTSLANIGAIFHPCVCLFNAATIERRSEFWFYRDMTEQVAEFIEKVDNERLIIGKAYGVNLLNVNEWIKFAYKDTIGKTLCERMKNNPAYYDIKAPGTIFTRQLTEDIPTGMLPITQLGTAAGIQSPLLSSITTICENLLNVDFYTNGRTLQNLGLHGMSKQEILDFITHG